MYIKKKCFYKFEEGFNQYSNHFKFFHRLLVSKPLSKMALQVISLLNLVTKIIMLDSNKSDVDAYMAGEDNSEVGVKPS
jgi:hypothetical protein